MEDDPVHRLVFSRYTTTVQGGHTAWLFCRRDVGVSKTTPPPSNWTVQFKEHETCSVLRVGIVTIDWDFSPSPCPLVSKREIVYGNFGEASCRDTNDCGNTSNCQSSSFVSSFRRPLFTSVTTRDETNGSYHEGLVTRPHPRKGTKFLDTEKNNSCLGLLKTPGKGSCLSIEILNYSSLDFSRLSLNQHHHS